MKIITILAYLLISTQVISQTAIGTWKTIDDQDGKVKSHVTITEVDGKLYGVISKLIDPEGTICTACKGDKKDKEIVGMEILWDLVQDGSLKWNKGKIMDPKTGKTYKCKIELNNENELKVRGFIGFALLGRTQTWHRME